eukprot:TRINITY_DN67081_c0_g1_i9.p2 TRINITY_DN67081_c0_g1~~TRINITY_DN67081_c0_g1_i9.p2  ORF type:complete len:121 (-),score=27.76 TRINITY_DN67081_c0_g1_i9:750-1112(-)
MKCVLVFTALLAAWVASSEAAKTCQDISSCASGMAEFANMDQGKINEACEAMRGVLTCFDEVIADCKVKHPDIMEQQMSTIKPNMDQLKSLINDNCGSGAATTATLSLGLLLFAFLASFF